MVIIAWNHNGSLAVIFEEEVFKHILSIFITLALLNFLQGICNFLTSAVFIDVIHTQWLGKELSIGQIHILL